MQVFCIKGESSSAVPPLFLTLSLLPINNSCLLNADQTETPTQHLP